MSFLNLFSKNSKNVINYKDFADKFGNYGSFDYHKLYAILFPDNNDAPSIAREEYDNLAKLPKNVDEYTTVEITSFEDLRKQNNNGKNDEIFEQITSENEEQLFKDVKQFLKTPGIIDKFKKKITNAPPETGTGAGTETGTGVQNYFGGRKSHCRNKKTRKSRKQKKSRRANKK